MARSTDTSGAVGQVIFVPAAVAYSLLIVGYLRLGLLLVSIFWLGAYAIGLFKRFAEWPIVSKITLACSPPLIGLGCYFSTQKITYAMVIPGLVYLVLAIAGGVTVR